MLLLLYRYYFMKWFVFANETKSKRADISKCICICINLVALSINKLEFNHYQTHTHTGATIYITTQLYNIVCGFYVIFMLTVNGIDQMRN